MLAGHPTCSLKLDIKKKAYNNGSIAQKIFSLFKTLKEDISYLSSVTEASNEIRLDILHINKLKYFDFMILHHKYAHQEDSVKDLLLLSLIQKRFIKESIALMNSMSYSLPQKYKTA